MIANEGNITKTKCTDLNGLFTLSHLIDILDYDDYKNFLIRKGIEPNDSSFEGFVFMVKTVSRSLLDQISSNHSLNLQEDFTLSRAKNRGVPLQKIKNSCMKTIFLKNVHELLKGWWKSRDETQLKLHHKNIKRLLTCSIRDILEKNVSVKQEYVKFKKEEIIRRLAVNYILVFLVDSKRGFPMGYFFSLLRLNLSKKYTSQVFEGYKLSLIFILERLTNPKKEKEKKLISKLLKSKNWKDLDALFRKVQETFVTPLDKDIRLSFGFWEYFEIDSSSYPQSFDAKLFKKCRKPSLSLEEDLQQTLLWYPVQAMKGSYVFNGVATFTSLLAGNITIKRLLGNEEKSYVARFVHPNENGNDYSYAVLIEAYSNIADYSGWLVFFDCAGDYSGFSGSEYRFAEMIIDRYKKRDAIEVIEYKISSKAFLDYLAVFSAELTEPYDPFISKIPTDGEVKKHKKLLENISLAARARKLNEKMDIARGLLLELVAYYYINSKSSSLRWRYTNPKIIEDKEIDLVALDFSNNLTLISCMSTYNPKKIQKLVDEAKKFESNRKVLKKEFGEVNEIKKAIVIPTDLKSNQIRVVKNNKMDIYSLQTLFREDETFSRFHKFQLEALFGVHQEKGEAFFRR